MAEAKTSTLASASGLPCSAVRMGASSPALANSASAMANKVARRADSSSRQSRWALAAASKAASSCSRVHSGAWANTSSVAGLTTPKDSAAGTESPPMVMTKSDMVIPLVVWWFPPANLSASAPGFPGDAATRVVVVRSGGTPGGSPPLKPGSDRDRLLVGRGWWHVTGGRIGRQVRVDGHPREDAVQPLREPPVGLTEQEHHRGHHRHADDDGIDQDAAGQAEAEFLDDPDAAEDEGAEDQDHDERGGGDRLARGGQSVAHGHAVVAT